MRKTIEMMVEKRRVRRKEKESLGGGSSSLSVSYPTASTLFFLLIKTKFV